MNYVTCMVQITNELMRVPFFMGIYDKVLVSISLSMSSFAENIWLYSLLATCVMAFTHG
jgi:hypothetical protein